MTVFLKTFDEPSVPVRSWDFSEPNALLKSYTFDEPGALVVGYDFSQPRVTILDEDFTDASAGWILSQSGTGTAVIEAGLLQLTRGASDANSGQVDIALNTVAGEWYPFALDITSVSGVGSAVAKVGTFQNGEDVGRYVRSGVGLLIATFQATSATTWIRLVPGDNAGFDATSFLFQEEVALSGWSVSGVTIPELSVTSESALLTDTGTNANPDARRQYEATFSVGDWYKFQARNIDSSKFSPYLRLGSSLGSTDIATVVIDRGTVGARTLQIQTDSVFARMQSRSTNPGEFWNFDDVDVYTEPSLNEWNNAGDGPISIEAGWLTLKRPSGTTASEVRGKAIVATSAEWYQATGPGTGGDPLPLLFFMGSNAGQGDLVQNEQWTVSGLDVTFQNTGPGNIYATIANRNFDTTISVDELTIETIAALSGWSVTGTAAPEIVGEAQHVTTSTPYDGRASYTLTLKTATWYQYHGNLNDSGGSDRVEIVAVLAEGAGGDLGRASVNSATPEFACFAFKTTDAETLYSVENDPFGAGANGRAGVFDDLGLTEIPALDGATSLELDATVFVESGVLELTNGPGGEVAAVSWEIQGLTTGSHYVAGLDNVGATDGVLSVGTTEGDADVLARSGSEVPANTADILWSLQSPADTLYLSTAVDTDGPGDRASYDNIRMRQSLVADPTFDIDGSPAWQQGPGVTIANGVANFLGGDSEISQDLVPDPCRCFFCVDIKVSNYAGGSIYPAFRDANGENLSIGDTISAAGSYSVKLWAVPGTDFFALVSEGFQGDVEFCIPWADPIPEEEYSPFYGRMRSTAVRMLQKYGQQVRGFTQIGTGPGYTPGVGITTSTRFYDLLLTADMYDAKEIDGVSIIEGDMKATAINDPDSDYQPHEPKVGDEAEINGRTYRIQTVSPVSPAGEVVVYELQFRP